MKKYLENEKNINGREFYSTIDDLKSKNVKRTLSFYTLDNFTKEEKSIGIEYLLEDIRKHKVDAIFHSNTFTNYTQPNLFDLSSIHDEVKISFYLYVKKILIFINNYLNFKTLLEEAGLIKKHIINGWESMKKDIILIKID